jgi:hypothetical protein
VHCGVFRVKRATLVSLAAALMACVWPLLWVPSAQAVVELEDFRVEDRQDGVLVTWVTGNELTTYGFNLHRATTNDFGASDQLNEDMIKAKQFPQAVGANYSYLDTDVETGTTYYYWLEVLDVPEDEIHGPEWTTHGPTATATSTSSPTRTPTFTATSLPASTPTPTTTVVPSSTPTSVPSITSTFTATSLPGASPSHTPTATVTPDSSSPGSSATTPLPTTSAAAQPPSVSPPAGGQPTATSLSSPAEHGGVLTGSSQSRGTSLSWPSTSMGTVLLLISVTSFLGAVVVLMVYVVVRRLGA